MLLVCSVVSYYISSTSAEFYCRSSRLRPLLYVLFHMCGQILCNPYGYALHIIYTHKYIYALQYYVYGAVTMFRGMASFRYGYRREAMRM